MYLEVFLLSILAAWFIGTRSILYPRQSEVSGAFLGLLFIVLIAFGIKAGDRVGYTDYYSESEDESDGYSVSEVDTDSESTMKVFDLEGVDWEGI